MSELPEGMALTPLNPAFREHPHAILEALRAAAPVHLDRAFERFYLTRYADVRAVLNDRSLAVDPRKLREDSPDRRNLPDDDDLSMLRLDDPDHKRLRGLVAQAFNQRSTDAMRPRIAEVASALLDDLAGAPSFDLLEAYAAPLPTIVIAEMMGVDATDLPSFRRWSDAMIHVFNPAPTDAQRERLIDADRNLKDYFADVVARRRRVPRDDLVGALAAAEEQGERLSAQEIVTTCNLLLLAGNMTTTDLIGNGVLALLEHPAELGKLQTSPQLIRNAVEEMLRFDPPVAQVMRVATCPTTIGGCPIAAQDKIESSLLAAGRDPAVHADPHRFDVERLDPSHVAFGGGVHFCLGAPLARAEAQIGITALLDHFPSLSLDPARPPRRKAAPTFNGLEALWLVAAARTDA
ncbi:cytochrome P450 [Lichenicoccus sp.]|uniref:cytochrome P450 n=1 Tax=Lichenicoccus sp. TaxID=2781899 RepID=UPI003D0E4F84